MRTRLDDFLELLFAICGLLLGFVMIGLLGACMMQALYDLKESSLSREPET